MKDLSRQQEIVLKLNLLDSRVTKTKLLMDYYRKRRNDSIRRIQMLQLKQIHLICSIMDEPIRYRSVWTYSQETTFWEVQAQTMSDSEFKENFGMNRKSFNKLCEMLIPMTKNDSELRKCIPLDKRVAICLYTLRSAKFYSEVSNIFGIGKSTVCILLKTFTETVLETMKKQYLPRNFLTPEAMDECVRGFEELGVPQCFGAIDGYRFDLNCRSSDGKEYLTLLALVDHNHTFRYAYVDSHDSWSYLTLYNDTPLPKMFASDTIKDRTKFINGTEIPVFIIGDLSFNLSEHVMKPFVCGITPSDPEKMFNEKLLQCHKLVDETLTQLKARFGRLTNGIPTSTHNAANLIYTCCILHNFLQNENDNVLPEWIEKQLKFDDRLSKNQTQEFESIEFNLRAEEIRNCLAIHMYDTKCKRRLN